MTLSSQQQEARDNLISLAVQQYKTGSKIAAIAQSAGVTTATIHKWLKEWCTKNEEELQRRHPHKVKDIYSENSKDQHRSEAARLRWERKKAREVQSKVKAATKIRKKELEGVDALTLLHRLGLVLEHDNLGHYIAKQGLTDGHRIYLSDEELRRLTNKPLAMITVLAPRINAALGRRGEENV